MEFGESGREVGTRRSRVSYLSGRNLMSTSSRPLDVGGGSLRLPGHLLSVESAYLEPRS